MFRAMLLETVVFFEAMTWRQLLKAGGKVVLAAFIAFGGLLHQIPFDPPDPPRATVSAEPPAPVPRAFDARAFAGLHDEVMKALYVSVDVSDTQVRRRYTSPSRFPYERATTIEYPQFKATIVFAC